jgi:DNA-binding transcriptional LysR family regulator
MTFSQLEAFVAVSARNSFTLAAVQLGISQSGVSQAIRALEAEWGVTLFRRGTGHIELTNIGARLLPRAQAVLGLNETMQQEASDSQGMKRGSLRIGSFGPTSSLHLLPPILTEFERHYPGIAVWVDEGPDREVVQWLLDRRIDIGFVVLPDNRFDTTLLLEDQMVALIPNHFPQADQDSVELHDLCHAPFVLTEAGSFEIVDRLFASAKLRPNVRYRTAQLLSTLDLVSRGVAVTIVAEAALPSATSASYVVKRLNPPICRSVGLAALDFSEMSPAATAFHKLAIELATDGKFYDA